jgi:peptidoglycan/xylan/chitin deacetylase (PgdA/CDA1 family)
MPGLFIISLDFELHWGVFDKRDRVSRMHCYASMADVVPNLLAMFRQYNINATWATVGSLFLDDEEEWLAYAPSLKPLYENQKYSSYSFARQFGLSGENMVAHFAPNLVKMIAETPEQEIATHTFSHYYCLEKGQTVQQFEADLQTVQAVAKAKIGKPLASLVFPRNQYNAEYLAACARNGITAVRTNPENWYWTSIGNDDTSFVRRLFRTGDVFVPLGARSTFPIRQVKQLSAEMPVRIPASRLLRQFDSSLPAMNRIRLRRIMNEMTYAAQHNECFHLWWHPENFGFHPRESLIELGQILEHFHTLREQCGFQNKTMAEVAKLCMS